MFRKVLKYDMASIKRYWWMIAVIVLAMSVVGSLVFRGVYYIFENEAVLEDSPLMVLVALAGIIFLFVCVLAIFSSVFITAVMTHLRYYRNFFTDEGYLTFTLPVSRKTLYLSKTVNTMFWSFAHVLLLVASIAIVLTIAPPPETGYGLNFVVWEALGDALSLAWGSVGAWLIVYVAEVILLYLCASAMSVGLIQFCITVGSIVTKKYKLLASIGIYYGVNMVMQTVMQIVFMIFGMFMGTGFAILLERATMLEQQAVIAVGLLLGCLAACALALVMHFVTLGLLERKLNLS